MQATTEPKIEARAEQPHMGIRLWIPSKDLSTWTTKLLKELRKWMTAEGLEATGPASTASTSSTWEQSSTLRSVYRLPQSWSAMTE